MKIFLTEFAPKDVERFKFNEIFLWLIPMVSYSRSRRGATEFLVCEWLAPGSAKLLLYLCWYKRRGWDSFPILFFSFSWYKFLGWLPAERGKIESCLENLYLYSTGISQKNSETQPKAGCHHWCRGRTPYHNNFFIFHMQCLDENSKNYRSD